MDRQTYISWATELRRRAVGAVATMVGSDEAEDVAQVTMLRMWERLDELDGDKERLMAYAATTARNLAQNRRRQKRRHPLLQLLGWHDYEADGTPLQQMESAETGDIFEQAMSRLPYGWQAMLRMRNTEERSFTEIADILGTTESSVRGTLSKARKRLLELIKQQL